LKQKLMGDSHGEPALSQIAVRLRERLIKNLPV